VLQRLLKKEKPILQDINSPVVLMLLTKIKRIASSKEIDLDVRIIIATNENLEDCIQKGTFREDLYHRFNEFSINVPSLKDRGEDIMVFADFFLAERTRNWINKFYVFLKRLKIVF
jgi:two-component system response regulator HydG